MILSDLAHNLHFTILLIFRPVIKLYIYFNLVDGKKDDSHRII